MAIVAELEQVVNGSTLPAVVAYEYLRLYVAEIEWEPIVGDQYMQLKRKQGNAAGETLRKLLSCAILLRAYEPSVPLDIDNPSSMLRRIPTFHQYKEKDWFALLQQVIKRDIEIQAWRREALSLGIVDNIQFQPYYRQAYNWMFAKAEEGGITPSNKELIESRLTRLTQAYGGSVICNLFTRHNEAIKRVLNWRSGYFLERQIFRVYTPEQVFRIKELELRQTNQKLIRKLSL